jgi:hypothetical protein
MKFFYFTKCTHKRTLINLNICCYYFYEFAPGPASKDRCGLGTGGKITLGEAEHSLFL